MRNLLPLLTAFCLYAAPAARATTYVVNPQGTGDFPTIRAAVAAVIDGDVIELTNGTFTGDGNRDVDLLGKHITIRSAGGDPASCVIACQGTAGAPHRAFRCVAGEDTTTVLQGLTITGGYGDYGGGMFLANPACPMIVDCVFSHNTAEHSGGGIYGYAGSAVIRSCRFTDNTARYGGGAYVECVSTSLATLADCSFSNNHASMEGGGLHTWRILVAGCDFFHNMSPYYAGLDARDSQVTDCVFEENHASASGGGARCDCCSAVGCTFRANTADQDGGGFFVLGGDSVLVQRCTFADNVAGRGAAIGIDTGGNVLVESCTMVGGLATDDASVMSAVNYSYCVEVYNCVFAYNHGPHAFYTSRYSEIYLDCCDYFQNEGGLGGLNVYTGDHWREEDPLFCGPFNPQEPYSLQPGSPCLPEGDPFCGLIGAWPLGCGLPQAVEAHPFGSDPAGLKMVITPNPARRTARVVFTLPPRADGIPVEVGIYDATGRLIRSLGAGPEGPGPHDRTWDGKDEAGRQVPAGIFVCRLSAGGAIVERRLVVVR